MVDNLDERNDKPPQHIVDDDLSFDSIMLNPILKPIAQVDNKIQDYDEMLFKKIKDMEKDKAWIDEAFDSIPEYSTSNFVARIVKLKDEMVDIVKIQDLEIASLKMAIKEISLTVKMKYGLLEEHEVHEEHKRVEKKKKEESFDYLAYLQSIIVKDGIYGQIAKVINERMEADTSKDTIGVKFDKATIDLFKQEEDKEKKKIIQEILALKLKSMEVK